MAWFTRFPRKVLKFTPARPVDLCRLKSMTEIFDFAITTSTGTVDKKSHKHGCRRSPRLSSWRAARKSTAEGTSRGNAPIAAVEFQPLTG